MKRFFITLGVLLIVMPAMLLAVLLAILQMAWGLGAEIKVAAEEFIDEDNARRAKP